MKVYRRNNGGNGGFVRHQTQLVYVDHVIEDPEYGSGVVGRNLLTGTLYLYFTDPVPSESAMRAKRRNTMSDWTRGLSVNRNSYTVGAGSTILVSQIGWKASAPAREVTLSSGETAMVQVRFVQWISCWESMEIAAGDDRKTIAVGYLIPRVFNKEGDAPGAFEESLALNFFQMDDTIFTARDLPAILRYVDDNPADSWMVRLVDKERNIIGQGAIVRAVDFRNPDKASIVFSKNLCRLLGVTLTGLADLVSDTCMEIWPLSNPVASMLSDDKKSLKETILQSSLFVQRDEEGNQSAINAIPCAIRGRVNEGGTFWLDSAVCIGLSKMRDGEFQEGSEIIPADAFSGELVNEKGELPAPLERVTPEIGDITVLEMRDYCRAMGFKALAYPQGVDRGEYFEAHWDDRKGAKTAASKPSSQSAPRPPVKTPRRDERLSREDMGPAFPSESSFDDIPF